MIRPRPWATENTAAALIATAALAFFLANTFVPYYRPIDDAFISYRYSKQVVQGHGLVWNPGEPPVEGFTNFLLVVTEIPFLALGVDPLAVSRTLSVLCALATAWLLYRLTCSRPGLAHPHAAGAFAAGLFLCVPFLSAHVQSGLETASFAFHLLLPCVPLNAFLRLPLDERGSRRGFALLSAAGLASWLAGLCRPEGFVVGGLMIGVALLLHVLDLRAQSATRAWPLRPILPLLATIALAFVLPSLGYHAWRYCYFGDIFPNSYHIKVTTHGDHLPGLTQLSEFVRQPAVLFSMAIVLVRRNFSRLDLLALPAIAFAATFYLRSHPIMAFNHRFFVPYLPFLALIAAPAATRFGSGSPLRVAWPAVLVVGFALAFVARSPLYRDLIRHTWPVAPAEEETHFMLGKRMAALRNRHDLLVVGPDAGAMPYFSETRWIDPIGLNDNFIARHVRSPERTLIDYLFERDPDIFILCKNGNEFVHNFPGPLGHSTKRIYEDRRFEKYVEVARYGKNSGGRYAYVFYVRGDLRTIDDVRGVLARR